MSDPSQLSRLFSLLSSLFLLEPSPEALTAWRDLMMDIPLPEANELKGELVGLDVGSAQLCEDLLWEYTRLFVGPNHVPCPPFESVYTSPERVLHQEAFLQVQTIYREAGFEIGVEGLMPDHVGVELNFMAILFQKISDDGERKPFLEALAGNFMAQHLRNWVPRFTQDLEEAATAPLYKALARVTREWVEQDLTGPTSASQVKVSKY